MPHLLSLEDDSRKAGSCGHHERPSTPPRWPRSSRSGDTLLRRSHSCSVGDVSSSEPTISCVATSGFHCSTDVRFGLQGGLGSGFVRHSVGVWAPADGDLCNTSSQVPLQHEGFVLVSEGFRSKK